MENVVIAVGIVAIAGLVVAAMEATFLAFDLWHEHRKPHWLGEWMADTDAIVKEKRQAEFLDWWEQYGWEDHEGEAGEVA